MKANETLLTIAATATLVGCSIPFIDSEPQNTLEPPPVDKQAVDELISTTVLATSTTLLDTQPITTETNETVPTTSTSIGSTATATTLAIVYIDVPTGSSPPILSESSNESNIESTVQSIQFVFQDGVMYDCVPALAYPEPTIYPEDSTQSGFIARINGFPLEAGFGSRALNAALESPQLFLGIEQYSPEDEEPDTVPYCSVI
jgi:hypothetical protein